MFLGTYKGHLDKLRRIVVPKELRKPLVEKQTGDEITVYLTRHDDKILIYPSWEWKQVTKELETKSLLDIHNRDEMLQVGKSTYPQKFYKENGRVKIPDEILEGIGIEKNIIFEGAVRFICIRAAK